MHIYLWSRLMLKGVRFFFFFLVCRICFDVFFDAVHLHVMLIFRLPFLPSPPLPLFSVVPNTYHFVLRLFPWATRGVTVSISAFLACHKCYCTGSSLAWGLNLRACGIF